MWLFLYLMSYWFICLCRVLVRSFVGYLFVSFVISVCKYFVRVVIVFVIR